MNLQHYLTYLVIVIIATVTPGPSMLMAINHGAHHGLRRSVVSSLGNVIGNVFICLIALAGLKALLTMSATLFYLVKWAGVLYLIFIGIRMFFEPVTVQNVETGEKKPARRRRIFAEGFLIAVCNPKGIAFFTALFPQFIDIGKASLTEFLTVFVTLAVVAFFGFMLYAFFGSRIQRLFAVPQFRRGYNRACGTIFAGTGVAMAFAEK
jgi:homoserine/homoserine lactone efflux protein